jgi:putative transposase
MLRMAIQAVRRTYRASIRNQHQVRDGLDALGFAASKLWNVGRWTVARIWDACGQIPTAFDLQKYLKKHERYGDLHSQSSQRVLAELGEAFEGWYEHRRQGTDTANPPGYRKHGDEHPRSTVTFKQAGFKHDATHGYLRLSKGQNLKANRSDFVLCSYETRPDVDLSDDSVSVQQVRAVWTGDEWELHIVCTVKQAIPDAPGDETAGVDLGICNLAAVSFGDDTLLYPGGALKEDKHYFKRVEYECEGENGPSNTARWAKRTLKRRRRHYLHALSKDIIAQCVEKNVGRLRVGDLGGIRAEENGDGRSWGRHGNKRLHGWAFSKLTDMLEYKGESAGIDVVVDTERDTSKTCAVCGHTDKSQRVRRGLYHCEQCGRTANADCTGAENIRQTLLPNPDRFDRLDRDNGCLAQPAVRLFDPTTGAFHPQE